MIGDEYKMKTIGSILGILVLLAPFICLIKVIIDNAYWEKEKKKPENQKYYFIRNCQASPMPIYDDNYEGYPGDNQMAEKLANEIGITKHIAQYVVSIIHIGTAHTWGMEEHLATLQQALLDQYGPVAVSKYSIILGLLTPFEIKIVSRLYSFLKYS